MKQQIKKKKTGARRFSETVKSVGDVTVNRQTVNPPVELVITETD